MSFKISKFSLYIPQDISTIYCEKKKILIVQGPVKKKSMKLKLRITFHKFKKILSVSPLPFFRMSNAEKKKIKMLRNTTLAKIKHLFIESSIKIFQKLNLIGVGFKADFADVFLEKTVLTLKLGLSHLTYIKIPENLQLNHLTKTKFCVHGNSYTEVSKFAATIRSKKLPEPYKGKGFLYENEVVVLKEGKKV